jgi:hypothetical protein
MGCVREGFRLIHFSVQSNHLHPHDWSLLVLGARRARARSKWFSVSFGVGVDAACLAPGRIGCGHPDGLPGPALTPSADARALSMNARPYILSAACWLCAWQRRRIRSER